MKLISSLALAAFFSVLSAQSDTDVVPIVDSTVVDTPAQTTVVDAPAQTTKEVVATTEETIELVLGEIFTEDATTKEVATTTEKVAATTDKVVAATKEEATTELVLGGIFTAEDDQATTTLDTKDCVTSTEYSTACVDVCTIYTYIYYVTGTVTSRNYYINH